MRAIRRPRIGAARSAPASSPPAAGARSAGRRRSASPAAAAAPAHSRASTSDLVERVRCGGRRSRRRAASRLPSASCRRNDTRLVSRYSRTRPPPDSDSTSLSSIDARDVEDRPAAAAALSTTRRAAGAVERALQLGGERRRRRRVDVDRRERVADVAAQVEAAGAEQQTPRARPARERRRAARDAATDARSDDDIDEPPGHDDDLLHRRAGRVLRDLGARARRRLDRGAVGARRHDELAAQLAVDLQHELDLVLRQRRGVDLAATARRAGRRARRRSRGRSTAPTSMCGTTG